LLNVGAATATVVDTVDLKAWYVSPRLCVCSALTFSLIIQ